MHFQVQLAKVFVNALVIGIVRQRTLIEVERRRIISQHAVRVAEIVQHVGVIRSFCQSAIKIGKCVRILFVMDEAHGRGVVILGQGIAHASAAIAAGTPAIPAATYGQRRRRGHQACRSDHRKDRLAHGYPSIIEPPV
jgi:hypothetical protein